MKRIVWFFLLLAPILLVFQSFFRSGSLAWGDAPFFWSEGLIELINEPLAWTNRGVGFGGINLLIWISPLTVLYGILSSILKLGNDLTIRIVFYFPSVVFSILGTYFLSKYLNLSKTTSFFTSLVYVLNTYFLLIIDGGQVGFALAYGLFPLAILFLKRLIDAPTPNSYILALIFLMACSTADPRVAIIAIITIFVWQVKHFKSFISLIAIIISWIGLSSYWIIPLIRNQVFYQSFFNYSFPNTKLISAFTLFSPHWPENIFGKVSSPPFYFFLLPALVFIPLLLKKKLKNSFPLLFSYIIFCFLSVSSQIMSLLPFGFAFRDTSKFFIPVVLFAGMLIGISVETINKKTFTMLTYIYLLILVWPALFGKMNFVLSNRVQNGDLKKIYENLRADNEFFRTLWIPERHPLTYELNTNPAIDGQGLVKLAPFANINAGEDPFNFFNSDNFVEWFRVLGIKYVILSDNPRNFTKTEKEKNNWDEINTIISKSDGLTKVDWGINIPVFKISNALPRFFAATKIYGIVGKPIDDPNIPTLNYEDGIFDPTLMKDVATKSFSIVFNGGSKEDLQMSFLQKYFKSPSDNTMSQWAVYKHDSYLKYKYELLIRNVKFENLDYGRGIAFSTKPGEKIEFKFDVDTPGDYVFGYRSMVLEDKQSFLTWQFENVNLPKGVYKKEIENKDGLSVLNVVALVPKKEFDISKASTDVLIKNFAVDISQVAATKIVYKKIETNNSGPLKYQFDNSGENYWVIFSDNYNPLWRLKTGALYFNSYPVYSMINAFYVDPKWNNLEIQFKGQENVRWGMYFTSVFILAITIIYLWKKSRQS